MRYSELLDKPTDTVEELASKHGVPVSYIRAQLKRGIAVEQEHTKKTDLATEIALDHLGEDPDYYKKLAKVEVDEGWKSAVAAGTLAAATAMGSPSHAAEPSNFVAKVSMQVNGQTIKKEIKLGSDYQSADDARTAVEKFLAKKGVNNYTVHIERVLDEAFDQPYAMKWEKSEADDSMDALVRLPDGSNLSIMFNMDYDEEGEEVVQAEFWRNNSQEVTGEGDAQRIFATVLAAIQQYIKKHKPKRLSFSASKEVDMDADDVEKFNPESRAKLYDRLVQRYARAWGYRAFRADTGSIVRYELSRLAKGVAEDVPKPGPSSGAPKQFGPDAKIETRQMTAKQLIASVPGLPYYNNVVDDWDAKDYSWGVTKKVIEYATYLKDHPESLAKLPPVLVLNGKFEDGAHRVSAIWLLQKRMDPKNPLWANAKLNVQFIKTGVAENFHDGRNPQDKGDSKRHGVPTKASVSTLRKVAKQGGRKGQLAHWMANMKAGRAKKK